MRKFLALLASVFIACNVASAADADGTVRMVSDSLIQRLISEHREIKNNPQRVEVIVKTLVLPYFDTAAVSRRVLAKNWKAASPVQQQRFTEEFSAYLVRFYAKAFANYNGETIDFAKDVDVDERGIATVQTRIMRKTGAPIPVAYRMTQDGGQWKIIDVVIEGISLVQSKRDEYSPLILSNGLDSLIADLAAKNIASLTQ